VIDSESHATLSSCSGKTRPAPISQPRRCPVTITTRSLSVPDVFMTPTIMIERHDYSFLLDPPKESHLFTRTTSSYPREEPSPRESSCEAFPQEYVPQSMGENRHAASLKKFTSGVISTSAAALETVGTFLNHHIPDQVHIPDQRSRSEGGGEKVYCYRHQPDLRCQRRAPQEDTMEDIQKVLALACGRWLTCRRWMYSR
jgi:hypothetical protein